MLGTSVDGEFVLTEEEREFHTHILGTTRQGKSYFLQHLIRDDIDRGIGLCFLDPTDHADTAYKILKYCAKIGFEKVCLIDFRSPIKYGKLPVIETFHKAKDASIENVISALQILFQTRDLAETPRIQYYLPAILDVLFTAGMTLSEARYFMNFDDRFYASRRDYMLDQSHPLSDSRIAVESVFRTRQLFLNEFQSTIRRLNPLLQQEQLKLMLGGEGGIDFRKMVSEGWVILVNLCPTYGFNMLHTRLLGTLVIGEVLYAVERLFEHGWKKPYNLYIDEGGRFANRKVVDTLAHKLKLGLRVTVAHQYFNQFEDRYIIDAIMQLCDFKVMFHTPSENDRNRMMREMYGGKVPPEQAAWVNSALPKQTAIMRKPKDLPIRVKVPDVADIVVPDKTCESFITKLYENPWYHEPAGIFDTMNRRFHGTTPRDSTRPPRRTTTHRKAARLPDDPGDPGYTWHRVSEGVPGDDEPAPQDAKKRRRKAPKD